MDAVVTPLPDHDGRGEPRYGSGDLVAAAGAPARDRPGEPDQMCSRSDDLT
jgi:hypothetical protein